MTMILVIPVPSKKYFRVIYFRKFTIEEVERIQDEFNASLGVLEDYPLKALKYKEYKKNLLMQRVFMMKEN